MSEYLCLIYAGVISVVGRFLMKNVQKVSHINISMTCDCKCKGHDVAILGNYLSST